MDKDADKQQPEARHVIELNETQLASFGKFKSATRQLASAKDAIRESEITIFDLHKRHFTADFESVCDYFKHDSRIEVFQNRQAFAEKWKADCELSLGNEFLHFISVSDLPHVAYDYATAKWIKGGTENVTTLFGITANGVLGEIARTEGEVAHVINRLEISGFIAINHYVELLRANPELSGDGLKTARTSLSAVIEEIYLPFFRQPEEFCIKCKNRFDQDIESRPVFSWVALDSLRELIKIHLAKKTPWLFAVEKWANEVPDGGGWVALVEFPEDVSFDECKTVRSRLSDDAFWKPDPDAEYLVVELSGSAKAYSFPFLPPQTIFTGAWEHLRVLCKVSKRHSASYLEKLLSAQDGKEVIEAVRQCVQNGSLNPLKNAFVDLPNRKQQIQEWANSALESGRLLMMRAHVSAPKTNKLTTSQKRQLTRLKLSLLERLLGEETDQLQEFDRVIKPLPYFFEYPILQWERANEKMAFTSAVSLFHLLNKISCLIGFEEVLAAGKGTGLKTLLGEELVQQLSGKPSLGSWSKALEILERNSGSFQVWNDWFAVLAAEREERIRLINIRNRISHPDFILEEAELDEAKEQFATYFNRLIPKLRMAYSGMATVITHGRKIIRSDAGESKTVIDCEKLDAPVEPFPRMSIEMENSEAGNLSDECLTSLRSGHAVELRRFFQIRSIKASLREIFLYEREYSGHDAVWAGLTTAQSGKLETSAKLFD